MSHEEKKQPLIIEAPTREQINAAKRVRRNMNLPVNEESTPETKRQARGYVEGILLIILSCVLAFALHPFGEIAWIIAAFTLTAGVLVMVRGHFR